MEDILTWKDLIVYGIMLLTGFIGVPITQAVKNYFNLEDKPAIAVTVAIALVLALGQLLLSQSIVPGELTLKTVPAAFGLIFTTATLYYHLLKDNQGFLGQGFMLKKGD